VEKDEIVLREGESGNNLYIVLEGRFKCEKEGNSEIIKEYKAGEVFGELSLLYNHPRASTITALTDGRLC
jgi:cAMP-dependent protein kinase regulator